MAKIINADPIIGNFIIESIKVKNFEISIYQLLEFNKRLSSKIEKDGYYTKFDARYISLFVENYPFIVKGRDENYIHIINDSDQEEFQTMLTRYFRLGLPNDIVNSMKDTFHEVAVTKRNTRKRRTRLSF